MNYNEIYLHIATAHLLDAVKCAQNASGYLFNQVGGEKALEFTARINKTIGDISNIRADISRAIALCEIDDPDDDDEFKE